MSVYISCIKNLQVGDKFTYCNGNKKVLYVAVVGFQPVIYDNDMYVLDCLGVPHRFRFELFTNTFRIVNIKKKR